MRSALVVAECGEVYCEDNFCQLLALILGSEAEGSGSQAYTLAR